MTGPTHSLLLPPLLACSLSPNPTYLPQAPSGCPITTSYVSLFVVVNQLRPKPYLPTYLPTYVFTGVFCQVDVCLAHRDWFVASAPMDIANQEWLAKQVDMYVCMYVCTAPDLRTLHQAIDLRVHEKTWMYISIVQASSRGKVYGDYWFTDISLLVLVCDAKAGGKNGGRRVRGR